MTNLNRELVSRKEHPLRGVQFGEGNFLRAFVDYMIDISNEKGITDIGLAVIKPLPFGSLDAFDKQDNLYTVALRGRHEGELVDSQRVISCISQTIDPYAEYEEYLKLAQVETLEFVFSNTTEAGIAYVEEDKLSDKPASSFPGKFTQFLYHRFQYFEGNPEKGLLVIPCELIENNGEELKKVIHQYHSLWNLDPQFIIWLEKSVVFVNTLVDRIVTGYPKQGAEELFQTLGYQDDLLAVAEPFALWVIESQEDISSAFPLYKAGLPILFTSNMKPYRDRKVRILNGGHTAMVLGAFLSGEDIVRDCMEDETIRLYLEQALKNEIIPTLDLPMKELTTFSDSVIERFENPFIDHALLDISLNSVSKWKTRVLPSVIDYYEKNENIPPLLSFSLAALIYFYRSTQWDGTHLIGSRNGQNYPITDDVPVLEFFVNHSAESMEELAEKVLKNREFWERDLTKIPNFLSFIKKQLIKIDTLGAKEAMRELL